MVVAGGSSGSAVVWKEGSSFVSADTLEMGRVTSSP